MNMFTKNCARFFKFNFIQNHFVRANATTTKDVISSTRLQNNDILGETIKRSRDSLQILNIIDTHYKVMNNRHIMQSFRILFTFQKLHRTDLKNEDILNHPSFEKLCSILKKRSRELDIGDTIEALKLISYVGVKSDSNITQILLQLIRHQINNLSIQQIIFLQFILNKFNSNPLVDALQIALPIVLDINLKLKIDTNNIGELSHLLHFASKNEISKANIEYLVQLLTLKDINNVQTAKSIAWSLCDLPYEHLECDQLLTKCLDVLTNEILSLRPTEIDTTLSKLLEGFIHRNTAWYYHEKFANACAEYVIDKRLDVSVANGIQRRLLQFDHLHVPLIDYFTNLFLNEPTLLSNKAVFLRTYVSSIVRADYIHMKHIDKIKALIQNNIESNEDVRDISGVSFALELAILGCYNRKLLEHSLESEYLQRIITKGTATQCLNLLLLVGAITHLKKEYSDLLPNKTTIESAFARLQPRTDFPLETALSVALGGYNYFITNVNARLGYVIDHVLVIRKGGFPIAINQNESCEDQIDLEEIDILEDNQMVAIITFSPHCYAINSPRLKGVYSFMLSMLEARGIRTIPISTVQWSNLLDFERIPFLMQKINFECDKNVINVLQ